MKTFDQVCFAYQHSKSEVLNQTDIITEAAWQAADDEYDRLPSSSVDLA
jgi:hypothetical protein